MNKEEIEELKEFTIDLTDIDELALGLEVCSKKSNMVIQEFAKLIIELEQQCKKQKEINQKAIEYIKERFYFNEETGEYALLHTFDKCNVKELLDILKEVE